LAIGNEQSAIRNWQWAKTMIFGLASCLFPIAYLSSLLPIYKNGQSAKLNEYDLDFQQKRDK